MNEQEMNEAKTESDQTQVAAEKISKAMAAAANELAEATKTKVAAEKISKAMAAAANELAEATKTKVCILFYSEELENCGSFASDNLTPLEERGLIALANK